MSNASLHNAEAEQAVLGGLMLENSAWDKIVDVITESDFYRRDHRLIFRAIDQLSSKGQPCDTITLSEWLDKHGELNNAGGLGYLGSLANNIPTAANIKAYADIVREHSARRQLIQAANEISNSAHQSESHVDDLLAHVDGKITQIIQQHAKSVHTQTALGKPNLEWMEAFKVSSEEAEKYDHPEWLYANLIISGHVIAIPAPPNGGKTTIMMFIAAKLASRGIIVTYVNADVGQSDAKSMVWYADEHSFSLLLPDMKEGLSMDKVVGNLKAMNEQGGDFSGLVFIFDTLKKMTDVIVKSQAKELYKLLRGLSAKGMTIVLLAHTNKYNDSEGKPIFEGTGDLRSDVDEVIYFIPKKNDDGSMTVSTEPDKVRGKFEPISFEITPDREVVPLSEFIDVASIRQAESQHEKDGPVIELITESIEANKFTEAKIKTYIQQSGSGIGWRTTVAVLKRYTGKLWRVERTFQHNAKQYILIEGATHD